MGLAFSSAAEAPPAAGPDPSDGDAFALAPRVGAAISSAALQRADPRKQLDGDAAALVQLGQWLAERVLQLEQPTGSADLFASLGGAVPPDTGAPSTRWELKLAVGTALYVRLYRGAAEPLSECLPVEGGLPETPYDEVPPEDLVLNVDLVRPLMPPAGTQRNAETAAAMSTLYYVMRLLQWHPVLASRSSWLSLRASRTEGLVDPRWKWTQGRLTHHDPHVVAREAPWSYCVLPVNADFLAAFYLPAPELQPQPVDPAAAAPRAISVAAARTADAKRRAERVEHASANATRARRLLVARNVCVLYNHIWARRLGLATAASAQQTFTVAGARFGIVFPAGTIWAAEGEFPLVDRDNALAWRGPLEDRLVAVGMVPVPAPPPQ